MAKIPNITSDINTGYETPNIKRLVNTVAYVLGIQGTVHVMPMKLNFDSVAYAVKQGCEYIIFVNEDILRSDKINNFNIRMFIHEMWHVKQMVDKRLSFNDTHTKAYWNGKEYTSGLSHNEREWENEARQAEQKYFKQVKQLFYGNKENGN